MEEIYYKTFYGKTTVTISIAKRDDDSISFSVAKYSTKSKSHLESHQQFSLELDDFKEMIKELNSFKL